MAFDKETALRLIRDLAETLQAIDEEMHWSDRDEDEDFVSEFEPLIQEAQDFLNEEAGNE